APVLELVGTVSFQTQKGRRQSATIWRRPFCLPPRSVGIKLIHGAAGMVLPKPHFSLPASPKALAQI
ncbi:MAG: hypothetical protein ACK496_14060, partial [Acidobacteriota bacterium]